MDEPKQDMLKRLDIKEVPKAIEELSRQGISNRKRPNIASEKFDRVRVALTKTFIWHCTNGGCRQAATSSDQPTLLVEQQACHICNGKPRVRECKGMIPDILDAGIKSALVVSGTSSEKKMRELRRMCPEITWIFTDRNSRKKADITVLWIPYLTHSDSAHFTTTSPVKAYKRSITALVEAVWKALIPAP